VSDDVLFLYMADFEPLRERSPYCGGPETWAESEALFHVYMDVSRRKGVKLQLNLTPEAAFAHADLMKSAHREGVALGIQPNVPGFRYPTYTKDLGEYDAPMQRRIIGEALEDFRSTVETEPVSYTPCCGSQTNETHPILIEYGFKVAQVSAPGRYWAKRPDRCTIGQPPYVHWASACKVMAGWLPLAVASATTTLAPPREQLPFDCRYEWEPTDETRARYREVVEQTLDVMGIVDPPVKHLMIVGHNTRRAHRENMEFLIDSCREAVAGRGWRFVPAQMPDVRTALERAWPLPDGVPSVARPLVAPA
jgi:hypothetical protein